MLKTSVAVVCQQTTRLESMKRTCLDICFCLDATGSMSSHINKVKADIVETAKDIAATEGMAARFALVVYRDYSDGAGRSQLWPFQSVTELANILGTVSANGGGDDPEDCFGGLWKAATELSWEAPCRIIVWIGDAPQHGLQYHNNEKADSYPNGDPEGRTSAAIFAELQKRQIGVLFCKLSDYTDKMIRVLLQEAALYAANLLRCSRVSGDMRSFLHETLRIILAETVVGVFLGQKKEYVQVPATFEVNSLWKPVEESADVITLEPYQFDMATLNAIFNGKKAFVEKNPCNVTLRTTLHPADSGELRYVYYAIINNLKYVVKESKYEGATNDRKALFDQACIQAVSASLAHEYTLKLRNAGYPDVVQYVAASLLKHFGRPAGKVWLSLEPFIEGKFLKFTNNDGRIDTEQEAIHPVISAFSHFTYCYTQGVLMVTDLQGVAAAKSTYTLTDPAVHTADPKEYFPDPTNRGSSGMTAFFLTHKCSAVCRALNLKRPEEMEHRDIIPEEESQPSAESTSIHHYAMSTISYPQMRASRGALQEKGRSACLECRVF